MDSLTYVSLKESGFFFKKKFGQNFITDRNLLESIVALSGVTKEDTVVEIGCGAATLTAPLCDAAKHVYTYEIDRSLRPVIEKALGARDNVTVLYEDFMKKDLSAMEREIGAYKIVANLPYYLSSALISEVLERSPLCESLTVMVQDEVADRLCAGAGSKTYGAVTAYTALKGGVEKLKKVPRECFYPVPDVDSAVIKITREEGRLKVRDESVYKETVRAAFLSRRKLFSNNLSAVFPISKARAGELVAAVCGDASARGETFSPTMFAALSDLLCDELKK